MNHTVRRPHPWIRNSASSQPATPRSRARRGEVLLIFLKLGLTSFGGPIAHLGYFRAEFVERRRWLSERSYVDLVALAQFLPGPASEPDGICDRPGCAPALSAGSQPGLGFTLPSALLMVLFAYGAGGITDAWWGAGLLHGLKLVAVAIVAQAVFGMAKSLLAPIASARRSRSSVCSSSCSRRARSDRSARSSSGRSRDFCSAARQPTPHRRTSSCR